MKLFHKAFGHGNESLIILHGLFGSLDNWRTIAKEWENHFTVYLVDQRNHGHSPHSSEFSYPALASDVLELMENEGIAQANFIGHSMGGKTAMHLASIAPERVQKLIVADMGIQQYPTHHSDVFDALFSVPIEHITTRQDAEMIMDQMLPDATTRQFLLKALYRTEEGFAWRFNLPAIHENYTNILEAFQPNKSFHFPSLFLLGGKSKYVLPDKYDQIRSIFTNVHFEVIPNAGHWLHVDSPKEFVQSVNRFLLEM